VNFLFDENISSNLAKALAILVAPRHTIRTIAEQFGSGALDPQWIEALGKRKEPWVIVSGDQQIRRRPAESEALRASGRTSFFLAKGFTKQPRWEQVRWLINKWPEIEDMAARVQPGASFEVPKKGKLRQL